jgi:transposase-like protein
MCRAYHCAVEFEPRWDRLARPAEAAWLVNETDVEVRGERVYLHRPVDRAGNTIDFVSRRRHVAASKAFFRKAIKGQGSGPQDVT